MSQPKPSKKKSEYAGLAEDIKRQAQNKAEKQIKKRPKAVRDRRASKMPVLKQEAPVETAAVQEQPQPSKLGTGASHALAVQWRAQGGVAQTGPAPSFASPPGSKDSRAPSTTTRKRTKSGLTERNQPTVLVVSAIVVTAVLVIAVTGVLVGIGMGSGQNRTCLTEGCRLYSEALLAAMDMSVNPCDHFSQYVCGRYSHPGNLSVMGEALSQSDREIAMAARNTSLTAAGQNELQKTLRFMKSCLDVTETKEIDNTATVLAGLSDAGIGWPVPQGADADTLLKATVFFSEYMGWPSVLRYVIDHGVKEVSQVIVSPSELTKLILQRGYFRKDSDELRSLFTLLVRNYARVAIGRVNTTNGNVTYEEVMSAEERAIAYEEYVARASEMVLFSNTTDQSILKAMEALKQALSQLPWQTLRLANLSFATRHWPLVKKVLAGMVESPRDFEPVMAWHVVHYLAPITNYETATAYHELYSYRKQDALKEHVEFCFLDTVRFFGVAAYSLYVREHYTKAVREDVERLAKDVRRTFFATLTESTYDWALLTNTLKYLLRSQSPRIREILDDVGDIGFDIVANYRTMTVAYTKAAEEMAWLLGRYLWVNTPAPIWGARIRTGDVFLMPWGVAFPFYRNDVPAYLRYGTFVHQFAIATEFQYSAHKPEYAEPHWKCCKRSATSANDFSIHGATAIEASVSLYQKARRSLGKREEESLPDMAHMSPLQLFFVSGCYLECRVDRLPDCSFEIRWSAEFREAFHCPPDSPMLANETCPMFRSAGS